MNSLYNLVRMTTATTGTGTITLGSAVSGFLTFNQGGAASVDVVTYGISDGANSEIGQGTYTASGTTLTRTTIYNSTNSNTAISLSGSAQVFITAAASDFTNLTRLATLAIRDTSAAFDVTLAATSAPVLTAGRTLTLDMSNVSHTVDFGPTANTITFPNTTDYTVAGLSVAQTFTADQAINPPVNTTGLGVTGSLTGSASNATLNINPTWNTSGSPNALWINVTNTASGASSFLINCSTVAGGTFFNVGTDSSQNIIQIRGTNTSALSTTTLKGLALATNWNPGGTDLTSIVGIQSNPDVVGSSITIGSLVGVSALLSTEIGFTGTITTGYSFLSFNPAINGTNQFTNFTGFRQAGLTNGSGTTATITNVGFFHGGGTAVAGSSGTMNNTLISLVMPTGTNTGTANNIGLSITGNGQTGGTSNNWAINSQSTAPSTFAGQLQSTLATGTSPFTVASTTRVANLNVATAGNADTVTTNANLTGNVTSSGNATTIAALAVTNGMLAGSITAAKLVGTDIATVGTVTAGIWNSTKIGLLYGGTNLDMTGTGGASQVLKQTSLGGAITVGQLANTDITGLGTMSTQSSAAVSITGGTISNLIQSGYKVCTTQLDKTSSAAFATVTGMTSGSLTAGGTYIFRGHLTTTCGSAGGIQIRLVTAGALTATSISVSTFMWNSATPVAVTNATTQTLGTAQGATAVVTDVFIEGAIVVNVAGAMLVQMAQNVSNATTSSVFINSDISYVRVA